MVGAGSLIKGPKAGSQNFILQGLALAIALHIALLAIHIRFSEFSRDRVAPLNVSIQLEKKEIEKKPSEARKPKRQENLILDPKIIVTEVRADDAKSSPKPRIQISTSDESFKRFLQSETDHNAKSDEKELGEFSATFEPYFKAPETTPEISYREFQGALGGGQYKVYKNGEVTCVLNMVPLSFDDHVYGAGGGARDCTPKKKFDLNLRKNTRE